MLKLMVKWLNTKHNYLSYKSEVDDMIIFQEKLNEMLIAARVHFENLQASECYIVQNISNKFDYFSEQPFHHRHNFENFNIKRNEYIYDKVNMKEATKNFTAFDSTQNRAISWILLNELQHTTMSKNKFLEKFDKYSYKDIFFDIKEDSIVQAKREAESLLRKNEFPFEDFKSTYVDRIQDESRGLEEIGIFYPFKLDHDIFENKHFLFEINHLKFQKDDKNFLDIVTNFYKKYGINCDKSKDIFTLERYFIYPGFGYLKGFAYFDPFKNYEKYKTEYKQIRENITSKKLEFQDFIFELFDAFNKAQIAIVKFQHENLIDTLITTRSKNRQYSVRELIDIQIKKVENNEFDLHGYDKQLYAAILHAFKNQPINFVFSKNTKIDDMDGFASFPELFKQTARIILDDLLGVLSKDDSSKLQYIFDHYKEKINVVIQKYKLNLANKHIIDQMLLDLVFFYNDKNKEKLSKSFNSTIEKIYQKNQNRDIEKIIDFDFPRKFMEKHNDYFNMYKPSEIKTEDGKTKYMMMF